jgi:hypothetical protein
MSKRMTALYQEELTQYAQALRTQQVEAAQSATLAEWRCQEDAAHVQALAKEADMRCRHNNTSTQSPMDSQLTSTSSRSGWRLGMAQTMQ